MQKKNAMSQGVFLKVVLLLTTQHSKKHAAHVRDAAKVQIQILNVKLLNANVCSLVSNTWAEEETFLCEH